MRLLAESARLREALASTTHDTWEGWKTTHSAEIRAFSWGVHQGHRLQSGWHALTQGQGPHAGIMALSALVFGGWLTFRRRARKDKNRLAVPASGPGARPTGLALQLTRLSRLVGWARWGWWGWNVFRQWAVSAPPTRSGTKNSPNQAR